MITLKDIQIEKSIATGRLLYTKSWTVYLQIIVYLYAMIFGSIVCPYLIFRYELDLTNINDQFIGYYILPLVVFFGLYMTIRTFTELRLKTIQTNHDCEQNKQLILSFAETKGYLVRRKYNNCIILDQPKLNENYAKTAVLLLKDKAIYFTVIQDNFRLNTPTFVSHLFFTWRLKKWIQKNAFQTRQL